MVATEKWDDSTFELEIAKRMYQDDRAMPRRRVARLPERLQTY